MPATAQAAAGIRQLCCARGTFVTLVFSASLPNVYYLTDRAFSDFICIAPVPATAADFQGFCVTTEILPIWLLPDLKTGEKRPSLLFILLEFFKG